MNKFVIDVARDFSPHPFGRYTTDGKYSAERFRKEMLLPAIAKYDEVDVIFDGVSDAVGSSFYNESFAGLITKEKLTKNEVKLKIHIISGREDLKEEILSYIENAQS